MEAPQGSVLLQHVLQQSRRQKYQRTRKLPCMIPEMLQYCDALTLPLNQMLLQKTSRLASFGSAGEASSGSDDMTINSLDDVVSKLYSDYAESASDLRNAVQTLQRGVQAEIRNLCKRLGRAH